MGSNSFIGNLFLAPLFYLWKSVEWFNTSLMVTGFTSFVKSESRAREVKVKSQRRSSRRPPASVRDNPWEITRLPYPAR